MDKKVDCQLCYVKTRYSIRTRPKKEITTKKESKSEIKKTRNRPNSISWISPLPIYGHLHLRRNKRSINTRLPINRINPEGNNYLPNNTNKQTIRRNPAPKHDKIRIKINN